MIIIMGTASEKEPPSYPVFKGLQKPLEFLGLRGRYIYWGFGSAMGSILGFIIGYIISGFLAGLITLVVILGSGIALIFNRQGKGLHTKRVGKGTYIISRRSDV